MFDLIGRCPFALSSMLVALSIAGFDPSGGAGVLADIKTFAAFGVYGVAAVTSLTSQNTVAVYGAHHQPAAVLQAQLHPLCGDFQISAVKVGMLPTRESIEVVADAIEQCRLPNVVVDTVLRSSSGYDLIDDRAVRVLTERLFPLARLITPNLAEAERLSGIEVKDLEAMKRVAQIISEQAKSATGASAVLVKGGHLAEEATDVLYDNGELTMFGSPKIATRNTHGTGCTLSSAIAALLARGCDMPDAVKRAKVYLEAALHAAPGLGHGAGPLNHQISVETL